MQNEPREAHRRILEIQRDLVVAHLPQPSGRSPM